MRIKEQETRLTLQEHDDDGDDDDDDFYKTQYGIATMVMSVKNITIMNDL